MTRQWGILGLVNDVLGQRTLYYRVTEIQHILSVIISAEKNRVHPCQLHCPRGEIEQWFECKDVCSQLSTMERAREREREMKRDWGFKDRDRDGDRYKNPTALSSFLMIHSQWWHLFLSFEVPLPVSKSSKTGCKTGVSERGVLLAAEHCQGG